MTEYDVLQTIRNVTSTKTDKWSDPAKLGLSGVAVSAMVRRRGGLEVIRCTGLVRNLRPVVGGQEVARQGRAGQGGWGREYQVYQSIVQVMRSSGNFILFPFLNFFLFLVFHIFLGIFFVAIHVVLCLGFFLFPVPTFGFKVIRRFHSLFCCVHSHLLVNGNIIRPREPAIGCVALEPPQHLQAGLGTPIKAAGSREGTVEVR